MIFENLDNTFWDSWDNSCHLQVFGFTFTSRSNIDIVGEIGGSCPVPCPHPDGVFGFRLESSYHRLIILHVLDPANPEDSTKIQSIVNLKIKPCELNVHLLETTLRFLD